MKNTTCRVSISAPQPTLDAIEDRVQRSARAAPGERIGFTRTGGQEDSKASPPAIHIMVWGATSPARALAVVCDVL